MSATEQVGGLADGVAARGLETSSVANTAAAEQVPCTSRTSRDLRVGQPVSARLDSEEITVARQFRVGDLLGDRDAPPHSIQPGRTDDVDSSGARGFEFAARAHLRGRSGAARQ